MKDGMSRMGQSLFSCGRILCLASILQVSVAKLNNSAQIKGFERVCHTVKLFWTGELTSILHVTYNASNR